MNIVKGIAQCFLLFIVIISAAHARSAVPIVNHNNVAIPVSADRQIPVDQIKQAFIAGGARLGWVFSDSGERQLTGNLNVRNKHSVTIEVNIEPASYSIKYKDSTNMKYGVEKKYVMEKGNASIQDVAVIHPFYNNWIDNLIYEVNLELARMR